MSDRDPDAVLTIDEIIAGLEEELAGSGWYEIAHEDAQFLLDYLREAEKLRKAWENAASHE